MLKSNKYISTKFPRVFDILDISFFLFVIISIWFPVWHQFKIDEPKITKMQVEISRTDPSNKVLNFEEDHYLIYDLPWKNKEVLIKNAENFLEGKLKLPGKPIRNIGNPPKWKLATELSPEEELFIQSFMIPKTYLKAYKITKNNKYLINAKNVLMSWRDYDKKTWFPESLHWNDHSMAERLFVISEFWGYYRNNFLYDERIGFEILKMALRHVEFLTDKRHFGYRSNHGIMQNVASLYFCVAFPHLSEKRRYKDIAINRMNEQLSFYINREGVILEHSPHYQGVGLRLIGMYSYFLQILDEKIPTGLKEKYKRGKDFYTLLIRSDGSLPAIGDTHNKIKNKTKIFKIPNSLGEEFSTWKKPNELSADRNSKIFPEAGYAINWNEFFNDQYLNYWQTVLTWSFYPGHGHKHADELGFTLWGNGRTWLTSAGYWSYGTKGRYEATDWRSSNAPHLLNESKNSNRYSKILSYAYNKRIDFYEILRKGPDTFSINRQIIYVKPHRWLILDVPNGSENDILETCWITASDLALKAYPSKALYKFQDIKEQQYLNIYFSSKRIISKNVYHGGNHLPLGWIHLSNGPKPTNTVLVQINARNSWLLTECKYEGKGELGENKNSTFEIKNFNKSDNWDLLLKNDKENITISRRGLNISYQFGDKSEYYKLQLLKFSSEIGKNINKVKSDFRNIQKKYGLSFKFFYELRKELSIYLVLIIFMQEIVLLKFRAIYKKFFLPVRLTILSGWVVIYVLVHYYALR